MSSSVEDSGPDTTQAQEATDVTPQPPSQSKDQPSPDVPAKPKRKKKPQQKPEGTFEERQTKRQDEVNELRSRVESILESGRQGQAHVAKFTLRPWLNEQNDPAVTEAVNYLAVSYYKAPSDIPALFFSERLLFAKYEGTLSNEVLHEIASKFYEAINALPAVS